MSIWQNLKGSRAVLFAQGVVFVFAAFPLAVSAAPRDFGELTNLYLSLVNGAVKVLFMAAAVFFLFGAVKYVWAGDSEEKRKEGRNFILYGLIGLAVMVSVWGIVRLIKNSFFGQRTSPPAERDGGIRI